MKKTRNLLLLAVLLLSVFIATSKANATGMAWTLKKASLVCDPEAIGLGESSKCYYFGTADSTTEANTGFYMYIYTTKNLKIDDVEANTNLTKASAIFVKNSGATSAGITNPTATMPDGLSKFACNITDLSHGTDNMNESGCAVFYTLKGETAQFIPSKMTLYGSKASDSDTVKLFSNAVDGATPAVIGSITVSLPNSSDYEGCGEVCIAAYGVATEDDWATADCTVAEGNSKWSTDTSCSTAKNISSTVSAGGNKNMVSGDFYCYELTLKTTVVPNNVPTGSFISYTILAAGALIAICAVTIAKKNNKLQKI